MTGNPEVPLDGHPIPGRPCSLRDEAIALLPYSFIALDAEGIVLRVETPGLKGSDRVGEPMVGRPFFSDLLGPPDSARVSSRYRAMVRGESDTRFTEAIHYQLGGQERCAEMIFSYYASAGLGCVLFREAPWWGSDDF
jgi:hypothetical protein